MTLTAVIFEELAESETQPRTTTMKSRTFQGSRKYENYCMMKPWVMIFRAISMLKMMRKTRSSTSMTGSGSSRLGSSTAKLMQLAKMVSRMTRSNQGLNTICMTKLRNRLVVVQPQRALFAKTLVWFC